LRSFDFRVQRRLNLRYVLKISTRFIDRGLSFGNWPAIDCLTGGEAVRKNRWRQTWRGSTR
jgi:hypothetical protein